MQEKPTIRVLLLEDDEARIKSFKRRLFPHDDFYFLMDATDSVDYAIGLMNHNVFDLVFIDNDLRASHYASNETDGTGLAFTEKIVGLPNAQKVQLFVVHSLNDVKSRMIAKVLKDAGLPCARKPFVWNFQDDMQEVIDRLKTERNKRQGVA